jgi:hypothetical protein
MTILSSQWYPYMKQHCYTTYEGSYVSDTWVDPSSHCTPCCLYSVKWQIEPLAAYCMVVQLCCIAISYHALRVL